MTLQRPILLALLATTTPFAAMAQEATQSVTLLSPITLSASREPVNLSRTGATVSVITGEELQKSGDQSVANQLARLPGVSMTRNGGMGTSTALRLRGLSGPYIGVRIDGVNVADPSGTQCAYDFGSTTIGGISRIEVLRGSQSALFGSSAIGGVVDISTWRAEKEGVSGQAGLEAGSNATWSATGSVGVKSARGELSFTASRTVTDGISAYAKGTEDDGFRATFLSFHGAYDLTDDIRVGVNGFGRNSYTEFDSQTGDNYETEEGKLRGGRVYLQAETGAVSHELSYAHTETSRYYALGFVKQYDGDRDQIAYSGRWAADTTLSLNWGADRTEETFGSDTDRGDTRTTSVFGEVLYAPTSDIDLSLALRHDDHEVFGGKATGRAAVAWRPTNDWVIRAVAGTGFRAPSLYELYSAFGNTGLTPETSRSFELGAEYLLPNDGSIQITLFETRIDDLIQFDGTSTACASPWGCYAQVPGRTRTRGVELTGRYQIAPGWQVFGNYTYADARTDNASGNRRLVRVPRHDLTMGVEGAIADRWTGILSVQHVADFLDNGIGSNPVSAMPDYTVVNATVSYAINDTTQAYLRVENLLDEEYQTVRNYGQPGRQVFLGVRASF